MYARLVLSDLFLHGIGGAKYDQLTDLIIARFFGLQPPGFVTLSATVLLFEDRTAELTRAIRNAQTTAAGVSVSARTSADANRRRLRRLDRRETNLDQSRLAARSAPRAAPGDRTAQCPAECDAGRSSASRRQRKLRRGPPTCGVRRVSLRASFPFVCSPRTNCGHSYWTFPAAGSKLAAWRDAGHHRQAVFSGRRTMVAATDGSPTEGFWK